MKVLASVVTALCLATCGLACRCVLPEPLSTCRSTRDDPRRSALLVKVLSERCEDLVLPGQGTAVSRVEVLEVFKAASSDAARPISRGDEIDIETPVGSNLCGYNLREGEEHIVFLDDRGVDDSGNAAACEEKAKVPGPCRAAFPRWSYIKDTGKCEKFTYGGCQGTNNNFISEEECLGTCNKAKPCKAALTTDSCAGNIRNPSFVDKVQLAVGCTDDFHFNHPTLKSIE